MFSKEDKRDKRFESIVEYETNQIFSCFHESLKSDFSNFDPVCYHPETSCLVCGFLLTIFIYLVLSEPLILIIVCLLHSYNYNYLAALACCVSSVFILIGTYGKILCTCLYNPCCQYLFLVFNCLISISTNIYCFYIYDYQFFNNYRPGYDILFFVLIFCNIITALAFLIQFTIVCCKMCGIYEYAKPKPKDIVSKRIINSSEVADED